MYEARNLTTHGVIVGMTGSGKTGLSIAFLEEAAAIDGIPAGSLTPRATSLIFLLQFQTSLPPTSPQWLNPDDAGAQSVDQRRQTTLRASRGIEKERPDEAQRVRELSPRSTPISESHTPGSEAGLAQISILRLLCSKGKMSLEDLTQKVGPATALLGLSGISRRIQSIARACPHHSPDPPCLGERPRPRSVRTHSRNPETLK